MTNENAKMIQVDDFVILTQSIDDIETNSVGLVREMTKTGAKVFFIGKLKEIVVGLDHITFLDTAKTGKPKRKGEPHKYKICNVCHILKKEYKDFNINQTDVRGRKTTRPTCTECRKAIDGVALKSSEKKRMKKNEPKKFFTCPICKKSSIPGVTANLVMDHDHETGNAREWICDSCNTGLGRFKDDTNLLKAAKEYLIKHSGTKKVDE